MRLGIPLKYQICDTGAASSICPILSRRWGNTFRAGMGAESIMELLQAIDLEKESAELKKGLRESTGQKRARIIKRLEVVEAFRESGKSPLADRTDIF